MNSKIFSALAPMSRLALATHAPSSGLLTSKSKHNIEGSSGIASPLRGPADLCTTQFTGYRRGRTDWVSGVPVRRSARIIFCRGSVRNSIVGMRLGAAVVAFCAIVACGSCTGTKPTAGPRTTTTTTTSAPTTAATSPTTTTSTAPPFGARSFTVSGVVLSDGDWLTVGLHPTTAPVHLQASSTVALEVCPAGLDGGLNDSSWPTLFKFPSCVGLSASGAATLPSTDGSTHVAFAVKASSAGAPLNPLELTVSYSATDSFVEVIPPATSSHTYLTVTYTPQSTTTAAEATPVNRVTPAPGYSLDLMQAGRALTASVPCDFPTELTGCFGGVTPGVAVEAQLVGQGATVVLNLEWK